jgi:hypothetical protein
MLVLPATCEAGLSVCLGVQVFLRAIRECPWSKAVWLEGFALLGAAMGKQGQELLDVLREKELRVRTDLYEVQLAALDAAALLGTSN